MKYFLTSLIVITLLSLSFTPVEASTRHSSSMDKAIKALSSKPALEMPIPVLFGVATSSLSDTWGQARAAGRTHEGIDILAPRGTPVVSPTDAVVTSAETNSKTNTLGGTYVYTANPGGERYYYAHLDALGEGVKSGKVLKKGDLIGYVGNTGNAAGGATHLHFGIYKSDKDEATAGDGATNPFPRITQEFSLKDKMTYLTKILDTQKDPYPTAKLLVGLNRPVFAQASAQGITLPKEIVATMNGTAPNTPIPVGGDNYGPSRDLALNIQGDDVKWLQNFLIQQIKGPQAIALGGVGATGYFGSYTKNAMVEFQQLAGIPQTGSYDATTRAYLIASDYIIPYPTGVAI